MGSLAASDKYRTVRIACGKCHINLFRYKKKNGTKSGLTKIYHDRIVADPYQYLPRATSGTNNLLECPKCKSNWGRHGTKAGHKIFRCIGGKLLLS